MARARCAAARRRPAAHPSMHVGYSAFGGKLELFSCEKRSGFSSLYTYNIHDYNTRPSALASSQHQESAMESASAINSQNDVKGMHEALHVRTSVTCCARSKMSRLKIRPRL